MLDRAGLSSVDEALATELTLGTLRHRSEIDWALARYSHTPIGELPSRIRGVLRMGAYQLLFLDRIPPSAACFQAVALAKQVGHPGTARLVNAVMRHLAAAPVRPPAGDSSVDGIALRWSHPHWLVARWIERFGLEATEALCRHNNTTPPSSIRLNTLIGTPEHLAGRLREAGVETVASVFLPEGRRITAGSPAAREAAYQAGWYTPQDEGSMLVARVVDPRPGDTVIDACAAPGGKATHLAALMNNAGRVIACDIKPAKLEAVSRHCTRLGITIVETRHLDAAWIGREYRGIADRVLVDAPCSGLGVLRRRPEIKWRLAPEGLAPLAAHGLALLSGAAGAVRPGGRLFYSVCTIEPEEGPAVVQAFLDGHPWFEPVPIAGWQPDRESGTDDGMAFLYPHRSGTDGFFVAAFRRTQ
jgi:16S rRNA (cytosine967-C5)-methyltransferase